jgi:hypothetical protein
MSDDYARVLNIIGLAFKLPTASSAETCCDRIPRVSLLLVADELTDLSALLAGTARPGDAPHEGIKVAKRDFRLE